MCGVSRGIVWCMVLAVCATISTTAWAEMTVSGYTQARYNFYDDSMYKADEFDLRRVRLKAKGPINDQGTVATVQIDLSKLDETGSGKIGLKDATVEHPLSDEWHVRFGYSSVLFGFEVPYSSSSRLPLERSRVARKFFPGERDTGAYFIRQSQDTGEPEFVVAYSDGLADWEDDEQNAAVARLQWPLAESGVAGFSYLTANRTRGDQEYDQNVWGAHVRCNALRGLAVQAEYYDGELLGVDADGWYGQIEYAFPESELIGYYRYDVYDDGNPSHDEYARSTLGLMYQVDPKQRVTFQWEGLEDESGADADNFAFQWQFKY